MSDIRNHYCCVCSQLKPLNKGKQSTQEIVYEKRGHSSDIIHISTINENSMADIRTAKWQRHEGHLLQGAGKARNSRSGNILAGGIHKTLRAATVRIFPLASCLIHIEIKYHVEKFLLTIVAGHLPLCFLNL
jgi:hypothetical protein